MTTLLEMYRSYGVHPDTLTVTGTWLIPYVFDTRNWSFPPEVMDEVKALIAANPYGLTMVAYRMGLMDAQGGKLQVEEILLHGCIVEDRPGLRLVPVDSDPGIRQYVKPELRGRNNLALPIIEGKHR